PGGNQIAGSDRGPFFDQCRGTIPLDPTTRYPLMFGSEEIRLVHAGAGFFVPNPGSGRFGLQISTPR
ncbi:hypothetical protein, partial [Methylobacterium sp. WL64]|uniref:hypothetical protein n=1 Tax=Methylobacterium sp. WL64 TaxID=2603894 RepID=UPI001AEDC6AE